MMRHPAG